MTYPCLEHLLGLVLCICDAKSQRSDQHTHSTVGKMESRQAAISRLQEARGQVMNQNKSHLFTPPYHWALSPFRKGFPTLVTLVPDLTGASLMTGEALRSPLWRKQ